MALLEPKFVPASIDDAYRVSTSTGPRVPVPADDASRASAPTGPRRSRSLAGVTAGYRAERKATSSRQRSHSVAAQVLGLGRSTSSSSTTVLRVSIFAVGFDVRVDVSVEGGRPEGRGLPATCRAGSQASATFVGNAALCGLGSGGLAGAVQVEDFSEPISFFVAIGSKATSYVGLKGRWRHTALHAPPWDWRAAAPKPTEGKAVDVEISGCDLKINVRPQTVMELKRCLQLQALREAAEGQDYDTLRAQVTKARMASVDMEHIAQGEARLRELRELGLHVNEGCDKETVREQMSWSKVTSMVGEPDENLPCLASPDCPCNVEQNPGELLEILDGEVQECLQEFGPDGDRQLFEGLVEAALAVEEGCIWRAGGKFIFSEFNRNQSVVALTRMLTKHGKQQCAEMIMLLLKHSESKFNGFVTAIQVNFHPHKGTYHDQHRDIYSQKQSAGPNCTCQFQDCVGTVCYSLGSSRICMLETMTDKMSTIPSCGDKCEGRKELRWLHSGNSMFFNIDWNNNHTHGIPPSKQECGPRISLAFLLAAKPSMVPRAF